MTYLDLDSVKIGQIIIKLNNILKIRREKYEIIKISKGMICLPPKYKVRDTIEFDLLKKGSNRLTPTDYLVYYLDTKKTYFSSEEKRGHELKKGEIKIIS